MTEFLQLVPPREALTRLLENVKLEPLSIEEVEVDKALGRVTASPILASEDLPAFLRSAVDGYAVRAEDTFGASDSLPAYLSIIGEVTMGNSPDHQIHSGEAAIIYTGGMLPEGSNAVIMLEHTQRTDIGELEVYRPVAVNENLILLGEDVKTGEEVIAAGRRIRPAEIGGLVALGILKIQVLVPPKIGIISSGDEIVSPVMIPKPGQVRDVNSYTLSALVERHGGRAVRYGVVTDDSESLKAALSRALERCEAVVITAGSSAGTRDFTAGVIQSIGEPGVLVHGVNIRPGKPTILAVCHGKAVIGLPGNPVSALVIAGLFIEPVIDQLLGINMDIRPSLSARLAINLPSQAGREDYFPVKLKYKNNEYVADPIFFKSNLIFNLAKADGLAVIRADDTGAEAGDIVQVIII